MVFNLETFYLNNTGVIQNKLKCLCKTYNEEFRKIEDGNECRNKAVEGWPWIRSYWPQKRSEGFSWRDEGTEGRTHNPKEESSWVGKVC